MNFSIINVLLVAIGGGIGGIIRFWLSVAIGRRYGETFPWGTLVVNVTGAACIGVLAGLLISRETHAVAQVPLWAGLIIGVLGSYTTVSSFSLQTLALARAGEPLHAVLNIAGSIVLCLSAAAAGYTAVIFAAGSL
ncbi:MAG: fluoride efflux transporter CrcB [Pseudolabrys sp.]|nr:fluoride efflux transporter CrcB [Pseudolabrys sp.]